MEQLNKSIDALIDELFAEGEPAVQKSMIKDMQPQKETADEVKPSEKVEKDEARNAGRPKQISDIPQKDDDGSRDGNFDKDITEKLSDADGKSKEDNQVKPSSEMVKKSVTDAEWEEFQSFKKAQEASKKTEELRKAQVEQTTLIKSAVNEAISGIRKENEELKKSIQEQNELIKSMANKPQKAKAITNLQAVERFEKSEATSNKLSKAEVLDIAEDLMKSGKLSMENCIELENTGFIYEADARRILESEVRRRNK